MNWCREYVQKLLQKFPLVNFPLGSMQIRKHRWWLIRKAMSLSQSDTNCLWRQNDISTVRNQTDKGSLSFGGAHMTSHCVFNGFVQGYYCNANCCNILLESFVSLYLLSRSWRPPENSQHSFLLLLQSCCFFYILIQEQQWNGCFCVYVQTKEQNWAYLGFIVDQQSICTTIQLRVSRQKLLD